MPAVKLVVHYAEIGLKGRNRPRFEDCLLREPGADARAARPVRTQAPVRAAPRRAARATRPRRTSRERLGRVFGVAYAASPPRSRPPARRSPQLVDALRRRRAASRASACASGASTRRCRSARQELAVRARRAHPGEATGARVDLENPELWVELHLLHGEALLLHERWPGPGGLPVRSAGRALALLSGGIDSPVGRVAADEARLLALVRALPQRARTRASRRSERCAMRWRSWPAGRDPRGSGWCRSPSCSRRWCARRRPSRASSCTGASCSGSPRRSPSATGALALVTGDSVGQVSSQTLANLDTINRAATLPVLRPLVGADKAEIITLAKRIGTYEISIEPDEDCCSFLMPRQPATWTRPEAIEAIERKPRREGTGRGDTVACGAGEDRTDPMRQAMTETGAEAAHPEELESFETFSPNRSSGRSPRWAGPRRCPCRSASPR